MVRGGRRVSQSTERGDRLVEGDELRKTLRSMALAAAGAALAFGMDHLSDTGIPRTLLPIVAVAGSVLADIIRRAIGAAKSAAS